MDKKEHKEITGFETPEEFAAYQQGQNNQDQVTYNWIAKWTGSTNSAMGKLLSEKFQELQEKKFESFLPEGNYPRTLQDFVSSTSLITEAELARADKEGLIQLCIALKKKELEQYVKLVDQINGLEAMIPALSEEILNELVDEIDLECINYRHVSFDRDTAKKLIKEKLGLK